MSDVVVDVPRHSSVPRARSDANRMTDSFDTASRVVIAAFGERAVYIARTRLARRSLSARVTELRMDREDAPALLDSVLRASLVGVRVLAVGSEAEVYGARAAALRAGAIDEEIVLEVLDDRLRRVYCAHCGETSVVEATENDVVPCSTCARNLVVYYHFSARKAAYLGYMVDAEGVE